MLKREWQNSELVQIQSSVEVTLSIAASDAGIHTSWIILHPPHQAISVQTKRGRRIAMRVCLYNCTFIIFFLKGTL